ncbi:GTPase Der [Nymphon striatum]|nr:GTPase Der [Nymphon striatum]
MRRKAKVQEKLEKMSVGDGLRAIRFAEVVVIVFDATIPFEKQDLQIVDLIVREGRAPVIAFNKWDLIENRQEVLADLREKTTRLLPQVRGIRAVSMSGQTGVGVDKLMKEIVETHRIWNKRISTARLNKWLDMVTAHHPPPAVLPESYQRYMINAMREDFDMPGVPIRLMLRGGDNPFAHKAKQVDPVPTNGPMKTLQTLEGRSTEFGAAVKDPAGITWMADSGTYLISTDNRVLAEVSADYSKVLSHITLPSSPLGTGDTEGVAYLGNNRAAVVGERGVVLLIQRINDGWEEKERFTIDGMVPRTQLGSAAYDPATNTLFTAQKKGAKRLYRIDLNTKQVEILDMSLSPELSVVEGRDWSEFSIAGLAFADGKLFANSEPFSSLLTISLNGQVNAVHGINNINETSGITVRDNQIVFVGDAEAYLPDPPIYLVPPPGIGDVTLNADKVVLPDTPDEVRINTKGKSGRVSSIVPTAPPKGFSAGSILERQSFLQRPAHGDEVKMAFVKPEIKGQEIKIATVFHKKALKRADPAVPKMLAKLVTNRQADVLATAYAPVKPDFASQSPFDSLLKSKPKNSGRFIPPIGKNDHAWARKPLPAYSFSKKEQKCLAEGIYFEARGEPVSGQAAVAQVILNRVRNPTYPKTICGVVYQNDHWRNRCQFSFACDGIRDRVTSKRSWRTAQDVAIAVSAGKIWFTEVGSSTHYHATYVNPRWARSMKKVGKIGLHIFYRTYGGGWS